MIFFVNRFLLYGYRIIFLMNFVILGFTSEFESIFRDDAMISDTLYCYCLCTVGLYLADFYVIN